jgi:hypothetical protein
MAASTLRESESHLGAQLRRLRARLGNPKAITAMGAKLARLVYRVLKYGREYVKQRRGSIRREIPSTATHAKKAAQHGFTLVPSTNPA